MACKSIESSLSSIHAQECYVVQRPPSPQLPKYILPAKVSRQAQGSQRRPFSVENAANSARNLSGFASPRATAATSRHEQEGSAIGFHPKNPGCVGRGHAPGISDPKPRRHAPQGGFPTHGQAWAQGLKTAKTPIMVAIPSALDAYFWLYLFDFLAGLLREVMRGANRRSPSLFPALMGNHDEDHTESPKTGTSIGPSHIVVHDITGWIREVARSLANPGCADHHQEYPDHQQCIFHVRHPQCARGPRRALPFPSEEIALFT